VEIILLVEQSTNRRESHCMKPMKVVGINASPRGKKSSTLRLTNAVLAGAKEEGAETELIDLYPLKIGYCTGCAACYVTAE